MFGCIVFVGSETLSYVAKDSACRTSQRVEKVQDLKKFKVVERSNEVLNAEDYEEPD